MNTPANTTKNDQFSGLPSFISDYLCSQLLEFQTSVAAREPGQRFPTPQENNFQCKLINTLIRVKKLPPVDPPQTDINGFLTFLKKEDGYLATMMAGKYKDFINHTPASAGTAATLPAAPAPATAAPQATKVLPSLTPTSPDRKEKTMFYNPPISRDTYICNRMLMYDYDKGDKHTTIVVDGITYNKQWFEYNMLQHTLPPAERRFVQDPQSYHQQFDHNNTITGIKKHMGIPL